jgi:hypothetical protein
VPNHGREREPPSVDGGVCVDDDARGDQPRGQPPPKCRRRCLARRRCLVPPLAKPRGKPDSAEALPIFSREQPRGSHGDTSSKKRPRPMVFRWRCLARRRCLLPPLANPRG